METQQLQLKRIRLAVFAFYFCQGLCFSSWASRIPDIKSFLSLDDAAWGTILFMIPIGQVCAMTISGLLVSKLGSRNILKYAFPLYSLSLLAIGLSTTQYSLILSLVFYGICGNFCNISVNTQGVTTENLYGKSIMSSFHGGWSLAGFTGSLIGLLMINLKVSPFHHFIFIIILVNCIAFFNHKYLQPDMKKVRANPEDQLAKKRNKPEKFLFMLGIVAFCGMAAEGSMFDWSGIYFKDVVKVPESLVPIGFTAFMIMMASGRFVADKAIRRWSRMRIIQMSGFLIFLGLLISVAYPHIIVTTIGFMIVGLGTSSIVPTIYSIAGQKTRIPTGLALTIVSSISFLGFLAGPPLIGYISHVTSLRYSYAMVSLLGICIIILVSQIRVFKKDKTEIVENVVINE
ncbi:MFS transporter [Dysgonomonas sp. ZJ279]|uniref:MFS transporter n=1 Tax=Dysgonomonas sp. ZJ279 TaxID=2709796 RepID=UPI0013EA01E7|nr:MFS transporter [Dysgonomonas sp. ZJ279]